VLRTIKQRRESDEGFTLIELMVVVLIIAILLAIAVPTFLGARQRAQARAAQSNVRQGFSSAKVFFTDNETYTSAGATTGLQAIEPSLTFNTTGVSATNNKVIFVQVADTASPTVTGGIICMSAKGSDGHTYGIRDISQGTNAGVKYFDVGATGTAPGCDTSLTNWADKW